MSKSKQRSPNHSIKPSSNSTNEKSNQTQHQPQPQPQPQPSTSTSASLIWISFDWICSSIQFIFNLFNLFIRSCLFQPLISLPIIIFILISFTPTALNYLFNSSSTKLINLFTFSSPSISHLTYLYCTLLNAPFFCGRPKAKPIPVNKITRSVAESAKLASDIFESVVGLGDPHNLGLHQADILELALAVEHSTSLEGKDVLASQLKDLSGMTMEMKDQVIRLNSQGINTFSFVAHQFSRLQDLIELIQSGSKKYTTQHVSHNLDILFERLSIDLTRLLNEIELCLPLASRATDLGTQLTSQLLSSHFKLLKIKENTPLWKKILERDSWSQKQLVRDLALTSDSVESLKIVWKKLEELRSVLVAYRNNVAFFKASLIGSHIADHQLSAEDEVYAMRHIIENFKQAVKESKSPKRHTQKLELDA
ncbi:hypothetical protein DFH28DRAFT_877827 [Melampsora americana]|nr:hypothetical protein DFH28DRAFT_877827 [Melampsora americana]